MLTKKQQQTFDKYVKVIHELLLDQIEGLRNSPDRLLVTNRSIFARMLGQLLYDAPKIYTGFVSIRLVEQKLKDFSVRGCFEHHHSRQKGGVTLLELVEKGLITGVSPTIEQVTEVALIHCQVHYTTVEENKQLKQHQRRCSSEAAYRRANIQLIEARDLFSKRGRHSNNWKQQMQQKYQPIVDQYNNPAHQDVEIPEMPLVIY